MIRKAKVSPKNKRALVFFEELFEKKEAIKKKLEKATSFSKILKSKKDQGAR